MKLELFADAACWEFKWAHIDEFMSYGCGPGGFGDFLVPDTVWGLSIRDACRIHDWGYRHCEGASEEERAKHDRILKNNSLRIVDYHTKWSLLKRLRYIRVETYYKMVRAFGAPAYWSERNKYSEIQEV
jgi:hypothetical protein